MNPILSARRFGWCLAVLCLYGGFFASAQAQSGPATVAGQAHSSAVLAGTVVDAHNKQVLPYAALGVCGTSVGTVANAEGTFRLLVPAKHTADTVEVRCLGYAPLRIRLQSNSLESPHTLALVPQEQQLREVHVTAYSPTSLIKKAVRNTTANMASPVVLHCYYREFARLDGQYTKFADGLVDYHIRANPRRTQAPDIQVRVRESRAGELPLPNDSGPSVPSPIDVEKAANYYNVMERSSFLDSTVFDFYHYELLETPHSGENESFYVVRCTPTSKVYPHLRQATVYIDRQSLTIYRIESEIPQALQPYMRSMNLLLVKAQGTFARKRIEYRQLNGTLFPSYVRLDFGMQVKSGRKPLKQHEFTSELLVSDISLGAQAVPFSKAEQHSGSLYQRGTHYQHKYWLEGNVVPATLEEEAVIKQLEKAGPLSTASGH